jgi:hypothetical protein
MVKIDEGDAVPGNPREFSGLVFMGGPMSVNDDLPWIGMQCHVEMTPDLIRAWCRDWGKEVTSLAQRVPSVQTPARMTERVEERTRASMRSRIGSTIGGLKGW